MSVKSVEDDVPNKSGRNNVPIKGPDSLSESVVRSDPSLGETNAADQGSHFKTDFTGRSASFRHLLLIESDSGLDGKSVGNDVSLARYTSAAAIFQ